MTSHDTTPPPAPLYSRPQARVSWGLISAALAVGVVLGAAGHALWGDRLAALGAGPVGTAQPTLANADALAQQARSLASQSQFAAALPVFHQALALHPSDAALLADTAETLLNLNGQPMDGEPAALVALALAQDPANLKALVLAANAAAAHRDAPAAAVLWSRALAAVPANQPDLTRQFQARLADAQRSQAAPASAVAAAIPVVAPPAAASAPAGSRPAVMAAAPAATDADTRSSQGAITGTVSIAPEIASNMQATDLVLITATAEGAGTPQATLRQRVKDLPYRFSFPADAASAGPGGTQRLTVQARVTHAEHPTPQAGDWMSALAPVVPGSSGVRLTVSEAVR